MSNKYEIYWTLRHFLFCERALANTMDYLLKENEQTKRDIPYQYNDKKL